MKNISVPLPTESEFNKQQNQIQELLKLSITEQKKLMPLDNYSHIAELFTNSLFSIILKIQNEPEIHNTDWHFIPFEIPDHLQPENGNYKQYIQFFCINDKKKLKSFTKKISKYFPMRQVIWEPFDKDKYNELKNK